jgi:hypothetical protein
MVMRKWKSWYCDTVTDKDSRGLVMTR